MDPTLALDWQRELGDTMRSAAGRRYMQAFVSSAFSASDIHGRLPSDLTEQETVKLVGIISNGLLVADTFAIDDEMVDLVAYAADTLPDRTVQPWTFPTTHGFVLLPTTLTFEADPDSPRSPVTVRAFMWCTRSAGVDLFFFSDNSDLEYVGRHYLGHLSLCHISRIKHGDDFSGINMVDHRNGNEVIEQGSVDWSETVRMMMMTVAFGHLSQQTISETPVAKIPRHAEKRWLRSGGPIDHVTRIVRLRRRSELPVGDGEREWHHRWVVRGHWRQQPCGPGRTLTRPVWIAAYVKGPEDAPLLVSDKVNFLVR